MPRKSQAPNQRHKSLSAINYRLVDLNRDLDEQGFYHGFPCMFGHTIRDKEEHWCAECVKRIMSNVCGFDVNFIAEPYRNELPRLLDQLPDLSATS